MAAFASTRNATGDMVEDEHFMPKCSRALRNTNVFDIRPRKLKIGGLLLGILFLPIMVVCLLDPSLETQYPDLASYLSIIAISGSLLVILVFACTFVWFRKTELGRDNPITYQMMRFEADWLFLFLSFAPLIAKDGLDIRCGNLAMDKVSLTEAIAQMVFVSFAMLPMSSYYASPIFNKHLIHALEFGAGYMVAFNGAFLVYDVFRVDHVACSWQHGGWSILMETASVNYRLLLTLIWLFSRFYVQQPWNDNVYSQGSRANDDSSVFFRMDLLRSRLAETYGSARLWGLWLFGGLASSAGLAVAWIVMETQMKTSRTAEQQTVHGVQLGHAVVTSLFIWLHERRFAATEDQPDTGRSRPASQSPVCILQIMFVLGIVTGNVSQIWATNDPVLAVFLFALLASECVIQVNLVFQLYQLGADGHREVKINHPFFRVAIPAFVAVYNAGWFVRDVMWMVQDISNYPAFLFNAVLYSSILFRVYAAVLFMFLAVTGVTESIKKRTDMSFPRLIDGDYTVAAARAPVRSPPAGPGELDL
eukprot:TRINITY_DN9993_c0_g1_i1.p1 TRINITY_DN9993_c0_g1~~TRINITY_DN9993_c0_g1_i1.p1  ORF type:complete len:534 (-),score=78.74 TRINITY_DN9993_c0_g1_i1:134-1735(-)